MGEGMDVPADEPLESFLKRTTATFVILGIAEDIGVLANYGNPGTSTTWKSFLHAFVNIQDNTYLPSHSIAVIGYFSFDKLKELIEKKYAHPDIRIQEYRQAVATIDDEVAKVIHLIVANKKVPVVVGGGHNNCYPMIKGSALALSGSSATKGINAVNLDAHTDYRLAEGRHSGNGFRYAKQEGYLQKYFAVGIHENYLPDDILAEITASKDIRFVTYDDIFIRQTKTWTRSLEDAIKLLAPDLTGIELDLDSIEHLPASASTPCGITEREALQFLHYMASNLNVAYLHICEGIATGSDKLVGKLISYLVAHFVKTYLPKINK
jgi:formiminoglutamase